MRFSARAFDLPSALGLELAGYAGPARIAARQIHALEGCVLRAVDEVGGEAFVIGLDLLFAGPELTRRLSEALAPAAVLVAASHTHSAPSTEIPASPAWAPGRPPGPGRSAIGRWAPPRPYAPSPRPASPWVRPQDPWASASIGAGPGPRRA
jgi:hypothetical protein